MNLRKIHTQKVFIIIICLTLILSIGISASSKIQLNNEFSQETIELTLEEAIEKSINNSSIAKGINLNEEASEALIKVKNLQARAIENYSYSGFNTSAPSKKDAEALRLSADFIEKQKVRNKISELNDLEEKVNLAYFSVLNGMDIVRINKANEERLLSLYDAVGSKFQLGVASKQQVIQAEYEVIKSQKEREDSETNLIKLKMNLNVLLGEDIMQNIILVDRLVKDAQIDIELKEAIEMGFTNRNELYEAQFLKELAEKNLEKLAVRYSSRSGYVKEWEVVEKQAILAYEAHLENIELDIRTKYIDMYQKNSSIVTLNKALERAEENLRLVDLAFQKGMRVVTDVKEAQADVLATELSLSQAILEYNIAVDDYKNSYGEGTYITLFIF